MESCSEKDPVHHYKKKDRRMEGAECGLAAVVGGVSRRACVRVCTRVPECVCRGGFLAGMGKLDLFYFFSRDAGELEVGGAGFTNSTSLYFIHLRQKKMKIFSEYVSVRAFFWFS